MKYMQQDKTVTVKTNARLHLGFLDLNGSQGRRFGSLGLGLNQLHTEIELAMGEGVFGQQTLPAYIFKSQQAILKYLNINQAVSIRVHQEMPRHSGLGSGTQMALAIGAGLSRLLNRELSLQQIALITQRGLRSGIGIGTFAQGGLVLDGGRGAHTDIPPIIAQHDFPDTWSILLIFDSSHVGVHGEQELQAFQRLQDSDLQATAQNAHAVLMRALPALKEQDLAAFGQAVSQLQHYTGQYFSPVQGGLYASSKVAAVLQDVKQQGFDCIGQSSWGPTGFAIFENKQIADAQLEHLQQKHVQSGLQFVQCAASNQGAHIQLTN